MATDWAWRSLRPWLAGAQVVSIWTPIAWKKLSPRSESWWIGGRLSARRDPAGRDRGCPRPDQCECGPLDGLVNNAGVVFGGSFLEVPLDRHLLTVGVNLSGVLGVTHAFLPGTASAAGRTHRQYCQHRGGDCLTPGHELCHKRSEQCARVFGIPARRVARARLSASRRDRGLSLDISQPASSLARSRPD